jgi:hypothetical protein
MDGDLEGEMSEAEERRFVMNTAIAREARGLVRCADMGRGVEAWVMADDILAAGVRRRSDANYFIANVRIRAYWTYGEGPFVWLRPPVGHYALLVALQEEATRLRRESGTDRTPERPPAGTPRPAS